VVDVVTNKLREQKPTLLTRPNYSGSVGQLGFLIGSAELVIPINHFE
jgi:hypothetical protein